MVSCVSSPLARGLKGLVIFCAMLLTGCATTQGAFELAMTGQSEVIDLTHPLNSRVPPGIDGAIFQSDPLKTIDQDGVSVSRIELTETTGTHIETPARFVAGTQSVEKLAPSQFLGFGVVLDVTKEATANPGYQVTRSDLESWESENGAIPAESILLIRTGWSERWSNPDRYLNQIDGKPTFPGISAEAVDFLVRERRVHGLGIDTPSLYAGSGNEAGQHGFLATGKYHIHNLTNLDQVPTRGAVILALPMKIQGAAGAPVRVLAIIPRKKNDVEPGKKKVQQETDLGNQGPGQGQGPRGGY